MFLYCCSRKNCTEKVQILESYSVLDCLSKGYVIVIVAVRLFDNYVVLVKKTIFRREFT